MIVFICHSKNNKTTEIENKLVVSRVRDQEGGWEKRDIGVAIKENKRNASYGKGTVLCLACDNEYTNLQMQ